MDEQIVTSQTNKHASMYDFYNGLLGVSEERSLTLDLPAFYHDPLNLSLDDPFTEDEVWGTKKHLSPDKALGPDGYNGRFY